MKNLIVRIAAGVYLLLASQGISYGEDTNSIEASRPLIPQAALELTPATQVAPGYCSSSGGQTSYEKISAVTLTELPWPLGYDITVQVDIVNPSNCKAGKQCPVYDEYPEFVNAWIDWNNDKVWDVSERVLDATLTGYSNINYGGTMTASLNFSPPHYIILPERTWLRANLGWGYDANDPCTVSWDYGNAYDLSVEFKRPEIKDITVKGDRRTYEKNPETGRTTIFKAEIMVPDGFKITKCTWNDGSDLVKNGEGRVDDSCGYAVNYKTDIVGAGQETYGPKTATLTVDYEHITSGLKGQVKKEHAYKVFFQKSSDDNGNEAPNWFDYWGDDGAVSALLTSGVQYDPDSNDPDEYGKTKGNNIFIGSFAAETHYPGGITVPSKAKCPGGHFNESKGIDAVATVIKHEQGHQAFTNNWSNGTWMIGQDTDSDDPTPQVKNDDSDILPDDYETTVAHTDPKHNDSCNLGQITDIYKLVGDQELQVRKLAEGQQGNAANDWASPGTQTTPPFSTASLAVNKAITPSSWTSYRILPELAFYQHDSGVTVLPGHANLTGVYSDSGVDQNSDGIFEYLKLQVGINVQIAEKYGIAAWIADDLGTEYFLASYRAKMVVGAQTIDLLLDGKLISKSGINGPYHISRIELTRYGDHNYAMIESANNVYTTASYLHTQFEPLAAVFTGVFSDEGMDANGNGLYEKLKVLVGVQVNKPGVYTIDGILGSQKSSQLLTSNQLIALADTTVTLSAGAHIIALGFDVVDILHSRYEGPLYLRNISLYDDSLKEDPDDFSLDYRTDYIGNTSYTLSINSPNSFEELPVKMNIPQTADQGLDSDNDGDFDYCRVKVPISSTVAGSFELNAELLDINGKRISSVAKPIQLRVGTSIATLDFPGVSIYEHQIDGPFMIYMQLRGTINSVDYYDAADYKTGAYPYTAFDKGTLKLTGLYGDYGEDTDGNGLYNSLIIETSVLPLNPGVIQVDAALVDNTGHVIGNFVQTTAVVAAVGKEQVIRLSFDGNWIR